MAVRAAITPDKVKDFMVESEKGWMGKRRLEQIDAMMMLCV